MTRHPEALPGLAQLAVSAVAVALFVACLWAIAPAAGLAGAAGFGGVWAVQAIHVTRSLRG